jgi:hypothetical protein
MAEPIIPRVKTETRTIKTPLSKSSENWWRDVRIRAPYKDTDTAFRRLPALGGHGQLESLDPSLVSKLHLEIARVREFANAHKEESDERQRINIKVMLERADAYLADAVQIQSLWESGFSTQNASVPPWPLNAAAPEGVSDGIRIGHERDSDKWKRLVRGALMNVRCAEEVAKKATIRLRNMERRSAKGRIFGTQGLQGPIGSSTSTGRVASGIRSDKLGQHAWSVFQDSKGYHARIMVTHSQFSPVKEEIGISTTKSGALKLLSDEFNKRLLAKYPNEKAKSDPALARASVFKAPKNTATFTPTSTNTASMLVGDDAPDEDYPEVMAESGDPDLEVDVLEGGEFEESSSQSPAQTKKKAGSGSILLFGAAILALMTVSKR